MKVLITFFFFYIYILDQTRPAVIDIMKMVDLTGRDGIISDTSPGVFLQVWLLLSIMLASVQFDVAIFHNFERVIVEKRII